MSDYSDSTEETEEIVSDWFKDWQNLEDESNELSEEEIDQTSQTLEDNKDERL